MENDEIKQTPASGGPPLNGGLGIIFFEICDTTGDEVYYSLGMFQTLDEIKQEIKKHDEAGEKVSEYAEEFEELTVIEHRFGWHTKRQEILKFKREEYYDENTDEYRWKTIDA